MNMSMDGKNRLLLLGFPIPFIYPAEDLPPTHRSTDPSLLLIPVVGYGYINHYRDISQIQLPCVICLVPYIALMIVGWIDVQIDDSFVFSISSRRVVIFAFGWNVSN